MAPYKYKDRLSRCRDVLYRDLYNGNFYTDKTTSFLRQAPGDLIQADVIKNIIYNVIILWLRNRWGIEIGKLRDN